MAWVKNASSNQTMIRVALVLDRQCNGASITLSELYADKASHPIISPLKLNFANRFRVLWTRVIILNDDKPEGVIMKTFRMNHHIFYNGNSGTIADLTSKNLAFVIFSNETTNSPTMTYYSRVRFIDN